MSQMDMNDGADGFQDSHTLDVDNPRPNADISFSDELLDKYLSADEDTGSDEVGAPAAKPKSLAKKGSDTRPAAEDDSDLDLDNTDDEDEGEGDELDEEEDEVDALLKEDEDEDGDEGSDEETFLSDFNREKFLKKYADNPDVMKAYKSFNADYTKAKQALQSERKEWEGKVQQADTLTEQYQSFAGKLADDEGMRDFLLQVALHRPEVFDGAYEQALSLNEDEGQKSAYLKEQQIKEREAKLEREENQRAQQSQQQHIQRIESLTHRAAEKLGLSGVEVEIAEQFVANAIYEYRRQNPGKGLPDDATVVGAVKAAASKLGVDKAKLRKEAERKARLEAKSNAQRRARDSKRPAPPRGGKSPQAPAVQGKVRHPNEDPMDALVDAFFGS
jgi:hypothetical protein